MADFTARRIDEMDAGFCRAFKRARAERGAEPFGLAVIDLPPGFERYPEHDHAGDRQEEVFLALRGSGWLEIDGEDRVALDDGALVRVGWRSRRRVLAGPDGLRVMVIGGVPGEPYRAPDFSRLGSLDWALRSGPAPGGPES